MNDNVNHPSHYAESCSIECIDVMELIFGKETLANYCIVNAFKYIWRYKYKNGVEDLNKAKWYLNKALKLSPSSLQHIRRKLSEIWNTIIDDMEDNND